MGLNPTLLTAILVFLFGVGTCVVLLENTREMFACCVSAILMRQGRATTEPCALKQRKNGKSQKDRESFEPGRATAIFYRHPVGHSTQTDGKKHLLPWPTNMRLDSITHSTAATSGLCAGVHARKHETTAQDVAF